LILLSLPEVFIEAKHGMENYGYIGGMLIGLYYVHKAYKRHLFRERDKVWFSMFYAIGEAVGAKWNADTLRVIERHLAERSKIGFTSSWVGKSPARSARRFTFSNTRRTKFMERLKSRKFWLAIVGALIPVINQEFNLNLDSNTILGILGLLATTIAGFAHVDAKKAQSGGATDAKHGTDSGPAV
jgi:hypothetical protein